MLFLILFMIYKVYGSIPLQYGNTPLYPNLNDINGNIGNQCKPSIEEITRCLDNKLGKILGNLNGNESLLGSILSGSDKNSYIKKLMKCIKKVNGKHKLPPNNSIIDTKLLIPNGKHKHKKNKHTSIKPSVVVVPFVISGGENGGLGNGNSGNGGLGNGNTGNGGLSNGNTGNGGLGNGNIGNGGLGNGNIGNGGLGNGNTGNGGLGNGNTGNGGLCNVNGPSVGLMDCLKYSNGNKPGFNNNNSAYNYGNGNHYNNGINNGNGYNGYNISGYGNGYNNYLNGSNNCITIGNGFNSNNIGNGYNNCSGFGNGYINNGNGYNGNKINNIGDNFTNIGNGYNNCSGFGNGYINNGNGYNGNNIGDSFTNIGNGYNSCNSFGNGYINNGNGYNGNNIGDSFTNIGNGYNNCNSFGNGYINNGNGYNGNNIGNNYNNCNAYNDGVNSYNNSDKHACNISSQYNSNINNNCFNGRFNNYNNSNNGQFTNAYNNSYNGSNDNQNNYMRCFINPHEAKNINCRFPIENNPWMSNRMIQEGPYVGNFTRMDRWSNSIRNDAFQKSRDDIPSEEVEVPRSHVLRKKHSHRHGGYNRHSNPQRRVNYSEIPSTLQRRSHVQRPNINYNSVSEELDSIDTNIEKCLRLEGKTNSDICKEIETETENDRAFSGSSNIDNDGVKEAFINCKCSEKNKNLEDCVCEKAK